MKRRRNVDTRSMRPEDFPAIIDMCRTVYPDVPPWTEEVLQVHVNLFPEGQLVAVDTQTDRVLGYAAALVVWWEDYGMDHTWDEVTAYGWFSTHNPEQGRTLYGADIMVAPEARGMGVGKQIYAARRHLCRRLGLRRIRAGARLRGYHKYADQLSPHEYTKQVINRQIGDPTLSFQLKQGFRVIGVVEQYLSVDEESHGHAAIIEWINHQQARRTDYRGRPREYARPRRKHTDEQGAP